MIYKIETNSEQKTLEIGEKLGKLLNEGDILCLIGQLGAGKTTLTKGIGKALNIKQYVTSPTFNIILEYEGQPPIYHIDLYRLNNGEEIYDLGLEEYIEDSDGVVIIEWAEKGKEFLPVDHLVIEIDFKDWENSSERIFKFIPKGNRYEKIIEELKENENTGV